MEKKLEPLDSVTVMEAMAAGANFEILTCMHMLGQTATEIGNTGKIDIRKIIELCGTLAGLLTEDLKSQMIKNMMNFSQQFPGVNFQTIIEKLDNGLGTFDLTSLLRERLQTLSEKLTP